MPDIQLASLVQSLDSATQQKNHYSLDKDHQNLLSYPLLEQLGPDFQCYAATQHPLIVHDHLP